MIVAQGTTMENIQLTSPAVAYRTSCCCHNNGKGSWMVSRIGRGLP